MAKLSKNRKASESKVNFDSVYSTIEAAKLVKETSTEKFDASIDLAVKLGVDPRQANQMVRGVVALPHGTGKDLKVLAFDLEISQSVKMLGSIQETNTLIRESTLVVHSSNKEGVPNVICEAMALEKPVVATNISGNKEAVSETYSIHTLSEPNNPNDLSQKIIAMLENTSLGEQIGVYNKQRIVNNYTKSQMVKIFLDSFIKHL